MTTELEINANNIREEEPGYLIGTAMILGVHHHIEFYRVELNEEGHHEAWQDPDVDNWNEGRLEILYRMSGDDTRRFGTVTVPARDGEYVCVVTPHAN